jgi:hypothetical protein
MARKAPAPADTATANGVRVQIDDTELAAAKIRGLTQDQLLALYSAGQLTGYTDGALWRAYMLRVGARQDRKAARNADA